MIYKEKMEEILQHYGVKGMTWDDTKKRLDEADKKVRKTKADKMKEQEKQFIKAINKRIADDRAKEKQENKEAWNNLGKAVKKGAKNTYKDAKKGVKTAYNGTKKVVANPKKSAKTAYAETKEFIKNPSLPKKKVKKKSPVKKTPVMQVGEKQGPPVAKGSISNYNRKPTTGRKTSLTSPKTGAPKSKMKITTHFDKYTGPTQKEFDETIKRARKSMYDKMSPYEKMKYNIRNRGKK